MTSTGHTLAAAEFAIAHRHLGPLLTDRWASERWSRGAIDPTPGGPARLVDTVGVEWLGQVIEVAVGSITVRLANPYDPSADDVSYSVTIRPIADGDRKRTRVSVDMIVANEADLPDLRARRLWQAVVGRIGGMVSEIRGRRTPEQAIVVIHGIGEQLPGRTLEGFVETMTSEDESPVWNDADRLSDSYELRRRTLAPSNVRPRTTFYEYYWANEVEGTTIGDVVGWLWSVMGRLPWSVPPRLRAAWAILWGLLLAVAVTAVTLWRGIEQVWWISAAVTVVLAIGASFLIR